MASHAVLKALSDAGLKPQSCRKKKTEDRQQFVDRMVKQLPRVLLKLESNLVLIGELYGMPPKFIDSVIQENGLEKHRTKGLQLSLAGKADKDAGRLEMKEALQGLDEPVQDKLLVRRNWPQDPAARAELIHECLKVSLVERAGDRVAVSEALNLPLWDVIEYIEGSTELQEAQERGEQVQVALAAHQVYQLKDKSPNPQAAKMVLAQHGNWKDRQETTLRQVGFGAPKDDDRPANILELVDAKKKESS